MAKDSEESSVEAPEQPLGESGTQAPSKGQSKEAKEPEISGETPKEETSKKGSQEEKGFEESFDPKKLSPELQSAYKQMQADYTKKTQNVADSQKKADAFDKLVENPKFREFLETGSPGQPDAGSDEVPIEEQDFQNFIQTTPSGQALSKYVDSRIKEGIGSLPDEYYADKADREIGEVKSKYGDRFEQNKREIIGLIDKYPTMPLEIATRHVLFPEERKLGEEEFRQRIAEKKKKSIESGGTSPVSTPSSKAKTIEEAYKLAQEQS